jgi:hypothetical protein
MAVEKTILTSVRGSVRVLGWLSLAMHVLRQSQWFPSQSTGSTSRGEASHLLLKEMAAARGKYALKSQQIGVQICSLGVRGDAGVTVRSHCWS